MPVLLSVACCVTDAHKATLFQHLDCRHFCWTVPIVAVGLEDVSATLNTLPGTGEFVPGDTLRYNFLVL